MAKSGAVWYNRSGYAERGESGPCWHINLQTIESEEDKSKFEGIYYRYRKLMFHVAMKILHNRQDAEDAVHQAFVSIIENLEKILPERMEIQAERVEIVAK